MNPLAVGPDYLALVLVFLPFAGGAVYLLWPRSAVRRRQDVAKWARRNLVPLTPAIETALDNALTSQQRLSGLLLIPAAGAVLAVAFGYNGDSSPGGWPWAISAALVLAGGLLAARQLREPWFAVTDTRSARTRAVALSDYVFPPVRWHAWASGVVCLVASGLVLAAADTLTDGLVHAAASLGIVLAVIVAEWSGRRAAMRPQPALDAAELYALDAWRAEVARSGFEGSALIGSYVAAMASPKFVDNALASGLLTLAGLALMITWILTQRYRAYGITWTRHRLWPSLPDGETIAIQEVTP